MSKAAEEKCDQRVASSSGSYFSGPCPRQSSYSQLVAVVVAKVSRQAGIRHLCPKNMSNEHKFICINYSDAFDDSKR